MSRNFIPTPARSDHPPIAHCHRNRGPRRAFRAPNEISSCLFNPVNGCVYGSSKIPSNARAIREGNAWIVRTEEPTEKGRGERIVRMRGLRYVCKYLSYIKWKPRLIKGRTLEEGGKKEDRRRLELPRRTLRCPRKYVTTQGVTHVGRSGPHMHYIAEARLN